MLTDARKADHLRIAAGAGVVGAVPTGLDEVRLRHRALPERDLDAVRLDCTLLGRPLDAPLLISAMTGGTPAARAVNAALLAAAAEHGVAMALGSGRALLDDPSLLPTYGGSAFARPPLLLANLGADALDGAARLVDLLDADGLSIHLNPLQEAIQPEGSPAFAGIAERIARAVAELAPLPVVAKEVGFGLGGEDVAELAAAGVAAVDVAGAGGTNWALVEGRRDARASEVAGAFAGWGVPTARALADAHAAAPSLPLIASGGVGDGVEAAKCLALGASAVGVARPLLRAAQEGVAADAVALLLRQLRIATWLAGAPSAAALGPEHLAR